MKTRILSSLIGVCLGWSTASAADESKDSYPLDVCVVSGKKLGTMGDPHVFHHEGREVRLCCKSCLEDFHAEPVKYMAKIQAKDSHPMAQNLENLTGKPLEVTFLKHMTHHHQMSMDMAKLATTHTERKELNQLGLEIIAKESGDIQQMNRWLNEWHQEKPGEMADAPMMGMMMGRQNALRQARDAEFDRMFIDVMIHHHLGAIKMAEIVREKSENEVLKTFSGKIVDEKTQQINQLENWRKEWFPENP